MRHYGLIWMFTGIMLVEISSLQAESGKSLQSPIVRMDLQGELGYRVKANVEQWLLVAPYANPAMVNMFNMRDREPGYENPVGWAGEFAGKYLIGAVQAMRMSRDQQLPLVVKYVVDELIASQGPNGYLGPFRAEQQLKWGWDLWGHYHLILGLVAYYDQTGDQRALKAAAQAADLIVKTFLNTGLRVNDVGAQEMNGAIIHGLGVLYRETSKQEYLSLMKQIEQEWEIAGAGDYLRMALDTVPFYQTPRPRWESLHDLEGFYELYRITGDKKYKQALLFDWNSINTTDIHNNGSFSHNEGATGNPFKQGAIETCCTVAWIALSVDALKLSADSAIADQLDLALWNAVMAYQHPSGRWSTYNTPMNGKREAATRTINFQSRAGSPELSCCAANAPRGLGMVSEWGVLADDDNNIYINYYGPGQTEFKDAHGRKWMLTQTTEYPNDGKIRIDLGLLDSVAATLNMRIPKWSKNTRLTVNGVTQQNVTPGAYYQLNRTWKTGDQIELTMDMALYYLRGDEYVQYMTSIYRGPLLLVYDQKYNDYDPGKIPVLNTSNMTFQPYTTTNFFRPMVLFEFNGADGRKLRLCDFATAGAYGTYYQSWLPVDGMPVGQFYQFIPNDKGTVPEQGIVFYWTKSAPDARYKITIARDHAMKDIVHTAETGSDNSYVVKDVMGAGQYFWIVEATNSTSLKMSANGPYRFVATAREGGGNGLLLRDELDENGAPSLGHLEKEQNTKHTADRHNIVSKALEFNGTNSELVYALNYFPAQDYTLSIWMCPYLQKIESQKLNQIACAWSRDGDDPLKLVIQDQKIFIRFESTIQSNTSDGVPIKNGIWYHLAVVKTGAEMKLYINGKLSKTIPSPQSLATVSRKIGFGCNPNIIYNNTEYYRGALDEIRFYDRALTELEIVKLIE